MLVWCYLEVKARKTCIYNKNLKTSYKTQWIEKIYSVVTNFLTLAFFLWEGL